MSDNSTIEWTDATWNPVTGCTKVSPGCDHCYAETFAERWRGTPGHHFENGFDVTLRHGKLDQPLRWRKARQVFVNSMSDLFHDAVPDDYIVDVFAVMALTPQHTYQLLTKRHGRMRSLLNKPEFWYQVGRRARHLGYAYDSAANYLADGRNIYDTAVWNQLQHLPNAWLGVSVEDQKRADLRIPALLDTPAAVRFLSCEPLLGPTVIDGYLRDDVFRCTCGAWERDGDQHVWCADCGRAWRYMPGETRIGWVIVGGESGLKARPMHPDWVRSLRDQCTDAGVPFFFKQFGAWVPESAWLHRDSAPAAFLDTDGRFRPLVNGKPVAAPMSRGEAITIRQVGKKVAGRQLDGRTWDDYPQPTAIPA